MRRRGGSHLGSQASAEPACSRTSVTRFPPRCCRRCSPPRSARPPLLSAPSRASATRSPDWPASGAVRSPTSPTGDATWPSAATPPPPCCRRGSASPPRRGTSRVLRAGAWTARGLRVPARNALLADVVPPDAYGRAYGFERAMDNLGAIIGPVAAIGLVTMVGTRWAIGLSVVPGLLATAAIVYAIRHTGAEDRGSAGPCVSGSGPSWSDHSAACSLASPRSSSATVRPRC